MSALEPGDVRFLILVKCEADGWWCAIPEGVLAFPLCPVCKQELRPARVAGEGAPAWRVHPIETEVSIGSGHRERMREAVRAANAYARAPREEESEDAWEALGYARRNAENDVTVAGYQSAEWPGLRVLRLKERMVAEEARQADAMRVLRLTVELPDAEPGQVALPGLEAASDAGRVRDVDL